MKKTLKYMNHFLSYVHMGSALFRQHMKAADNPELSDLMMEEIKKFREHEEKLKDHIKKYGLVNNSLSLMQRNTVRMSGYKLGCSTEEFRVSLSAIKSVYRGLTKSLEYLYRHYLDLPPDFLNLALRIVDFYSVLIEEHQEFLLRRLRPVDFNEVKDN